MSGCMTQGNQPSKYESQPSKSWKVIAATNFTQRGYNNLFASRMTGGTTDKYRFHISFLDIANQN